MQVRLRGLVLFATAFVLGLIVGAIAYENLGHTIPGLYRLVLDKERLLLYATDHQALASELRLFARLHRWDKGFLGAEPTLFNESDELIPASLRILRPSGGISIYDDRIEYDCGSPFQDFGIAVFRDEHSGKGARKLADGVWFFSDNNDLPAP